MAVPRDRWGVALALLGGFCLAALFVSFTFGSVSIPVVRVIRHVLDALTGSLSPTHETTILFDIRLPRILLGFCIGGALSLAGVVLQALFRNPLVEPYTLGVAGGAGLAASVVIAVGAAHSVTLPFAGFAGALASILMVHAIGRRTSGGGISGLLLTGIMVSFISTAVIMLILSISRSEEAHGILFWLMGNLEQGTMGLVKWIAPVVIVSWIVCFLRAWDLNAIALGDEESAHLGIDTERAKWHFLMLASLLAGVAVSVAGIIGFVGLVVPHCVRMLMGTDHRMLIPASFMAGGAFLVVCDTVARTVLSPVELPVGVITGIIGGVLFLWLILRKKEPV